MKIRLQVGKYLLSPIDPLPRGGPQSAKVGFTSANNNTERLPGWKVEVAPALGERQNGKEFPAQFREGEITQEDLDSFQVVPSFEGENRVVIVDETSILGAIEAETQKEEN
jgi:hypothetical protein